MTALFKSKKFLAILTLGAFMAVTLLSFTVMMHESNGGGMNGCLFSAGEVTLCPQNVLTLVMHHISAYQAFINVPVSFRLLSLLFSLLLSILAVWMIRLAGFLSPPQLALVGQAFDSPSATSYKRKTIHWLSLLENSPSVSKNV